MDLGAVLARGPEVALVDDLAHCNARGARHAQRWRDVEDLLAAGIEVISTVSIGHLDSLADVVAKITGAAPRQCVPDPVVRAADEIQLVDLAPEALRDRMARGRAALAAQRQLTRSLGGTYHQVIGEDISAALLAFAHAENATRLVLGATRRIWPAALRPATSISSRVIRQGGIGLHIVTRTARPTAFTSRTQLARSFQGPEETHLLE
jgi:K+-sensing histidine kinase KdpD